METDTELTVLSRVRQLVAPIAADLGLDLYDIEQRGGTLRITLDTPPSVAGGVTLDALALASRLMSKELDQHDPIPSRYTLEVTSPGVERTLRGPGPLPARGRQDRRHPVGQRRTRSSDGCRASSSPPTTTGVTIHVDDSDRRIAYADIDRAKTVFEWGGQPKPGTGRARNKSQSMVLDPSAGALETAEGSASDEADAAPKPAATEAEPAEMPPRRPATRRTRARPSASGGRARQRAAEGSASDEADAARGQSAAEAEPARAAEGSASDEADAREAKAQRRPSPPETAEGSASDEADAARGESAAEAEPADAAEGSASDEADAARGQSAAEAEPARDKEALS